MRFQHAERDAGFHVEAAHAFHHFDDRIELLAVTHLPPGSPHTEALRTRSFGRCCHRQHLLRLHQQVAGQIHLAMMGRLRAVGAVFRTATRLDRQEARLLHPVRVVILPVNRIGAAHEFQKRKPIERAISSTLQSCRMTPSCFASSVIGGFLHGLGLRKQH